jgi:hypothetical protein
MKIYADPYSIDQVRKYRRTQSRIHADSSTLPDASGGKILRVDLGKRCTTRLGWIAQR